MPLRGIAAPQNATGNKVKDVRDRKILHTEFFQSSVYYYSSYTQSKIDEKNLQLPMKKYSMCIRLLTVKITVIQMETSHAQLLEKGFQHEEEDSKNRILSQKEYITGEKVKIIEIIFPFCLPAG